MFASLEEKPPTLPVSTTRLHAGSTASISTSALQILTVGLALLWCASQLLGVKSGVAPDLSADLGAAIRSNLTLTQQAAQPTCTACDIFRTVTDIRPYAMNCPRLLPHCQPSYSMPLLD